MLAPTGTVVAESGAANDEDEAWTRGQLVFRDSPLSEVSADLRRWYGIDLRVADTSLTGRHLSATFVMKDPRDHVLKVIALSLGADIELRGDTAVLRSGAAGSGAAVRK